MPKYARENGKKFNANHERVIVKLLLFSTFSTMSMSDAYMKIYNFCCLILGLIVWPISIILAEF